METTDTFSFDNLSLDAIALTPTNAQAQLVMAHGAGADITHTHMTSIADALGDAGIATYRFNLPFMQRGGGRTDSPLTSPSTNSASGYIAGKI